MTRFKGYPDPRVTWRTHLVSWLFGRRKIRAIGVGRTRDRLCVVMSNLDTGEMITDIWITPEEGAVLARELDRQRGLLEIAS